ncbi:MAG: Ig-like domain-containing protein, partial [Lentisphaerae bacterium]|nr:Ig-like domain-containing protein [Lentisphaerota bacterium]
MGHWTAILHGGGIRGRIGLSLLCFLAIVPAALPLTVTINQGASQADPTNATPLLFDVLFSDSVADFATGDVQLSGTAGATTAVVAGAGSNYTVSVSGMIGSGTVIAVIPTGVAHDGGAVSNDVSTSTDNTVTYDIAVPAITNFVPADGSTNVAVNTNLVFFFNETVLKRTNGTITIRRLSDSNIFETLSLAATNVTVSGNQVTLDPAGTFTSRTPYFVQIGAAGFNDLAGNVHGGFTTSTNWNFISADILGPTVTVNQAATQRDPTNAAPIRFTVGFSESVSDFDDTDVTLGGTAGATTALVSGSGTNYTVSVSGMTLDGTVIVTILAGAANDGMGNPSLASVSGDNTVTFDSQAPSLSELRPPDGATNVAANTNLSLVFDETIVKGSGSMTIRRSVGGSIFETISVTSTNVTVAGNTATLNPVGTPASATAYYVQIPATCFRDNAGNAFAGFSDTGAWNFAMADTVGPTVTVSQAAGQPDPTNGSPIRFTVAFSEPVNDFTNVDVTIGGTAGATNAAVEGSSMIYTVSVSGMVTSGTVIVSVPTGAVHDVWSNANAASIGTDTTVTYDITPPALTNLNPAAGAIGVSVSANLVLSFTEAMSKGPGGVYTIRRQSDGGVFASMLATGSLVSCAGVNVTLNPTGTFASETAYYVEVGTNCLRDAAGNMFAGLAGTGAWHFVAADTTRPLVTALDPPDDATDVAASTNFTLTFDEEVVKGTSGNITLRKTSDGTAFETIAVVGGNVTVNSNVVTVDPSGTLATNGSGYYLQIAGTCFKDLSGNFYQGFTTATNWNFQVEDHVPPSVTANQASTQRDPTNGSPILFTVRFSEPVADFITADVTLGGTAGADTAV